MTAEAASVPRERNYKLDNAKGALIFIVVFAHLLELAGGWSAPLREIILVPLYIFCMPAFVFLAGATSRPKGTVQRVLILIAMLIAFQAAYQAQEFFLYGKFEDGKLEPFWLLWFLLAMIWYTLGTPLMARLGPKVCVPASIAIALAAGLIPFADGRLALSRTLVFLPFFVTGYFWGWKLLNSKFPRYSALVGLAVILILGAIALAYGLEKRWFFGSRNYAAMDVAPHIALAIRAALLSASALGVIALIAVTSNRQTFITLAGRTSLAVYLLHGFVVKGLTPTYTRFAEWGDWLITPSLLLAIPLVWLLGRDEVDAVIRNAAMGAADFTLGLFRRKAAPAT